MDCLKLVGRIKTMTLSCLGGPWRRDCNRMHDITAFDRHGKENGRLGKRQEERRWVPGFTNP